MDLVWTTIPPELLDEIILALGVGIILGILIIFGRWSKP